MFNSLLKIIVCGALGYAGSHILGVGEETVSAHHIPQLGFSRWCVSSVWGESLLMIRTEELYTNVQIYICIYIYTNYFLRYLLVNIFVYISMFIFIKHSH